MANEQRTQEYLISHTRAPLPAGVAPHNLQLFRSAVQQGAVPGIKFKRAIGPPPGLARLGLLSNVPQVSQEIIVAEVDEDQAETLRQQPQWLLERNLPLRFPRVVAPEQVVAPERSGANPGALRPLGLDFEVTIRVLDAAGAPLEGAEVYVFGTWQNAGVTDGNGEVHLSLFGETSFSIKELYVKPRSAHWDRLVPQPALPSGGTYDVSMRPLDQWFPNFPGQQVTDWGFQAMKLDQLLAQGNGFTGEGIRVAVIDSGAAGQTHRDLEGQVATGFDIITDTAEGWENDTLAHGTHCSGVVGGLDNGVGIRGFAPRAELFIYKIFPNGNFDHLIVALDKCIQDGVDVVNLSLGADAPSTLVEERLRAAKESGIACIVAAGNSAGPVQYPASSSHVLAVAAIGKNGTFPADSYHAVQVFGQPDANGYFSAKFSCFGPEIDVCAPGVAVLSSVPPNDYAAWDGTSMASPHVAGLAALVLAHHPDFQQPPYDQKNAQRVDRLFQILKQTAQPLSLGGPQRTGTGMPDAVQAFAQAVGPAPAQPLNGQGSALSELLGVWP